METENKIDIHKKEENRKHREKLAAMTPAQYAAAKKAALQALSGTTNNPRKQR